MIGRWATVSDEAGATGGTCVVRMRTDSPDWPAMALGSVGAEFTVLGPPAMVEHLRDWGARLSRAVRSAPGETR